MPDVARVDIEKDDTGWSVKVTNPGQRTQEYRCATKDQADKLAAVLTGAKQGSNMPAAGGRPAPAPAKKR